MNPSLRKPLTAVIAGAVVTGTFALAWFTGKPDPAKARDLARLETPPSLEPATDPFLDDFEIPLPADSLPLESTEPGATTAAPAAPIPLVVAPRPTPDRTPSGQGLRPPENSATDSRPAPLANTAPAAPSPAPGTAAPMTAIATAAPVVKEPEPANLPRPLSPMNAAASAPARIPARPLTTPPEPGDTLAPKNRFPPPPASTPAVARATPPATAPFVQTADPPPVRSTDPSKQVAAPTAARATPPPSPSPTKAALTRQSVAGDPAPRRRTRAGFPTMVDAPPSPGTRRSSVLKQSRYLVSPGELDPFTGQFDYAPPATAPDSNIALTTWEQAAGFTAWLTDSHRKAGLIGNDVHYRLPRRSETRSASIWRHDDSPNETDERRPFGIVLAKGAHPAAPE